MKIAGIQIRRRIFVSVGLLIAATGLWFYWSRANQPKISQQTVAAEGAFVRIAGAGQGANDRLMEERAEYFDPTPLFLPTNKNVQQQGLPARVVKQPDQVFPDFEPKLNFAESALPDYGGTDQTNGNSLPDVLSRGNVAPFGGFGLMDRVIPPLTHRSGYIEVRSLKNGALNSSETLNNAELPSSDFKPVEFIVAVASAGLIGDPVMIAISGNNEDIDGKLKDYLVNIYRIGERLAPGRYLVMIGP